MKLNRSSQLLLVSTAGLLVSGLISACSTRTVDFVYVSSSKAAGANNYGEIDVLEVNSESGELRRIPTSPFPSGGRNPVAEAVSSNFANLYVVNQDDNNIVQFAIGSDGKLYPQNTVNTPGVFPLAIAVNSSLMFAADTFQPIPSCSPAEPCSGSVAVFPLSSSGAPGTPVSNPAVNGNYWPLLAPCNNSDVLTPSAITVLDSGKFVYVTAYDTTAAANNTAVTPVSSPCDTKGNGSAPTGYLFAFSAGSGGALATVKGSPFIMGSGSSLATSIDPTALAATPDSNALYVTDFANSRVFGYSIGSTGALTQVSQPFPSGNGPDAITIDATGAYAYVANSLDNTLTGYTITSGSLFSFGSFVTGTQPVAVMIDRRTNQYVYTANYLGPSATGYQFVPGSSPTLFVTQGNPYLTDAQPTAMVGIPHSGQCSVCKQ